MLNDQKEKKVWSSYIRNNGKKSPYRVMIKTQLIALFVFLSRNRCFIHLRREN